MQDTNNGHNANDGGILSGLRVIDCGTYVAGPAAATVMSDFGAEVIKIERPGGGDLWRLFSKLPGTAKSELDWCWVLTSRNKKSVALDLGRPEGREALIRLVRTADVFLTNYQRTLLEKFRLTWEDLAPVNDRLIYAHLTGYGDIGAIMLGLYRRERTGRGSRVSTSLLASGAWANACDIQAKLLNAKFPVRGEGKHPPNPLTAAYLTRDGKIFLLVLIDPDNEFPRLCRAFGQPELGTGELFATNDGRDRNAAALYAILQSEFESRDLAEWRTIFKRNDIKWAPLPVLDEVVKDPQMRAAEAFVKMDYPGAGVLETVNSPVFVDGSAKRKPTAAAEVGAHTREVLQELGYSADAIDSIVRDPARH